MEYSDSHFIAIIFVFLFRPSQTVRWSATIPVCLAIRNYGSCSPKHLERLRLHISNWWIIIKIFSVGDGIADLCERRLATGWKVSTIKTLTAKTFDPQQISKSSMWQSRCQYYHHTIVTIVLVYHITYLQQYQCFPTPHPTPLELLVNCSASTL